VQAESTLVTAAANLELSSKELKRVRNLGEDNGIAQKDIEQAIANEQSARAAHKAAHDALRALGIPEKDIERLIASDAIPGGSGTRRVWALANVAESDSVWVRPGSPCARKLPTPTVSCAPGCWPSSRSA